VAFTRSNTDDITITERGVSGTDVSSHSIDDTFQESYSPRLRRIDLVIRDLLREHAGVSTDFIPFSDWEAEVDRWAPTLKLTADIMKPTGVAELIGELAILGITIWWDDVDQEIKLLVNRPIDDDAIKSLNDSANNIAITQEDRDKDRITQVLFNHVQIDPSADTDETNFKRGTLLIDAESVLPESYGDTRIRTINCRWLNHGDNSLVRVLSLRLLNKFKTQPVRYIVDVDYRDDINIAEVVELQSEVVTSDTGQLETQRSQVIMREDIEHGHRIRMTLQRFQFDGRYPYFTGNARPDYDSSNQAQKYRGAYWVDENTLLFGDDTGPYQFI
jgi:hypothetical protein